MILKPSTKKIIKRKKKVNGEIVPVVKKQVVAEVGKQISKLDTEDMKSILGEDVNNILNLLEIKDTDNAISLLYKKLIQSLTDLLPILETQIRKHKGFKGVYQYNKLIESLRFIIIDLQSSIDRGNIGETVVDTVLRPAFKDVATSIVIGFSKIEGKARNLLSDSTLDSFLKMVDETKMDIANSTDKAFTDAKNRARDLLQR